MNHCVECSEYTMCLVLCIRSKGNHYMNGMYCNSYPLCIDCVKKSKIEEVDCDERI